MTVRAGHTDSVNNDVVKTSRGISDMHSSRGVMPQIEWG